MRDLRPIKSIVELLLREDEKTRNDQRYLYIKVIERMVPEALTEPMIVGFQNVRVPSYDSVTRARRRVVSDNPELKGNKKVETARRELEGVYREFAKNG